MNQPELNKPHLLTNPQLQALFRANINCKNCNLNKNDDSDGSYVHGIGTFAATTQPVVFLGEGPGYHEAHISGIPFSGRAGKDVLQPIFRELNISLNEIYITNVVKHRPPKNRNPTETEARTCIHQHLKDEFNIVQPLGIICLGRIAAQAMYWLAGIDMPSGSIRGKEFEHNGVLIKCTWHPAYVCRVPERKKELVEDIVYVLARTGIIS